MFENFDKFTLWELTREATKLQDETTTQMLFEGEERGQTQRYIIAIGYMIRDLMNKIEESFKYGDMFNIDLEFMQYLQNQYNCAFIFAEESNKELVRNILENIVEAYRVKGTFGFLYWITYKVFGWKVVSVLTLASQVLMTSNISSYLYDPAKEYEEQKILYDSDTLSTDDVTTIIVDYFGDPEFADKKITYELLLKEWFYNSLVQYKSTRRD